MSIGEGMPLHLHSAGQSYCAQYDGPSFYVMRLYYEKDFHAYLLHYVLQKAVAWIFTQESAVQIMYSNPIIIAKKTASELYNMIISQ